MDLQELQKLLDSVQIGQVLLSECGEPRLEAFSGNALYSRRGMPTMNKYKTVKEVCDLTGLTRKHLYYFHHEKVVRAVAYANYSVEGYNGYKLYDDMAVEKLQQIALYSQWYDTASEVYGLYYDAASEIYSFYYDMASELYGRDFERAEKIYERFLEKIAKAKGQDSGNANTDATFDTTLRTANSVEELETVVDAHVTECVQALWADWEALSADIDTFDEYMANVESIEAFHTHIEDSATQIFVMICDYGVSYAELILQSGSSTKDMYNAFEDFKDCIYEDACEIVKDEIYEDLLGEIKDYYYEGIINDAKDDVQYSDWSDARGDAYSWWSDARGEVYSNWSDTRGDLYSFYSDMRSELYSGDTDGANDELQDFKDKIAKMN